MWGLRLGEMGEGGKGKPAAAAGTGLRHHRPGQGRASWQRCQLLPGQRRRRQVRPHAWSASTSPPTHCRPAVLHSPTVARSDASLTVPPAFLLLVHGSPYNYLLLALLTLCFLPLITPPRPVRVINVASAAHQFGKMDFEDLMRDRWVVGGGKEGRGRRVGIGGRLSRLGAGMAATG